MMETMLGAIDLAAGLVTAVPQLRQATESSEGGAGWLLAAGPVSAAALYAALYRYYRNTDKSHQYEKETAVTSQPVTGSDTKVDEVRGTTRKSVQGDNVRNHRQRVRRVAANSE